MKLSELLVGIDYSKYIDLEINSFVRDSRLVEQNSLFFAISGTESDGHSFAKQALENGAVAVVLEKDMGLDKQIIVRDTHLAYGVACGNFYGNPANKLKLIGVTGTNGKTTTAYIVKGILESLGKKTGLIGTIENLIWNISVQARHTTPDPYQLHSLFSKMVKAGCEFVVMEVSSHALDQQRLAGCKFISAGFSNLTQDHLDYHKTMENYYQAKKKFFDISDISVINQDDKYGKRLTREVSNKIITFSCENKSDLTAENICFSEKGSKFTLEYSNKVYRVEFVQPGKFSVSNAVLAMGLCIGAGISPEDVVKGISNCPNIPGRFEILAARQDLTVIRDFAHSADGLEKLLGTVKGFAKGRVVTLFGCAGERDRSKRKFMASTAAKYSDFVIMTADNPRSEPVEQILNDALPGFDRYNTPYKIVENRLEAIIWAVNNIMPNDYLILAGKGHEDYQVLDYGTINFDEKAIIKNLLSGGVDEL